MTNTEDIISSNLFHSGTTSGAINSNSVDPSYTINYVSEWKKILVGRNNNTVNQKLKIDNRIKDQYYFQIVNKNNQIVTIDDDYQYQFMGSFIDAKNQMHVVFYSDTYTITSNNLIKFKVNTYTSEYLYNIKRPKEIDLTIKKVGINNETIILRDSGIAYPCPSEPEQEPTPVIAGWGLYLNGYVLSLNKGIQGSISLGYGNSFYNDNDKYPSITVGKGLYGDANQVVVGRYNEPVSTAVFIVGNGTDYDAQHNALVVDGDGEIFGGTFYSYGVQVATLNDIPSAVSQLTNDKHYISAVELGYWDNDTLTAYYTQYLQFNKNFTNNYSVIGLNYSQVSANLGLSSYVDDIAGNMCIDVGLNPYADQSNGKQYLVQLNLQDLNSYLINDYNYATTGQIPTSTSQLTNDNGYISSIILDIEGHDYNISSYLTFNDSFLYNEQYKEIRLNYPLVSARLHLDNYALTGQIPTSTSQLTNDSGFITNSALNDYAQTSAIPTSTSQLTNDSDFAYTSAIPLSTSQLVNDSRNKVGFSFDNNTWLETYANITYDPLTDIYYTQVKCDAEGLIFIPEVNVMSNLLNNGQGFVVEQWIFVDDSLLDTNTYPDAVLHFQVQRDVFVIGDLPQTVTNHKVYSFARRVLKWPEGTIGQHISFIAEF